MSLRPAVGLLTVCLLSPSLLVAGKREGGTEITLFFGVSLLDAEATSPGPFPLGPPFVEGPEPIPVPIPFPPRFDLRRSLRSSFLQGFRVARYVGGRAQVAGSFAIAPSHHLRREASFDCPPGRVCALSGRGAVPEIEEGPNVVAYHYDLGFAYDLARGDVRPFLGFGVGGVSYDTPGRVETDLAFSVGGGVKMYFGKHGAQLEVVDKVVPDHFLSGRAEHDVQLRGGFLVRLP